LENRNNSENLSGNSGDSSRPRQRTNTAPGQRVKKPLELPAEDFPVRRLSESQVRRRPAVDPDSISRERGEIHSGRITGEAHSNGSTAAPLRVRSSEPRSDNGEHSLRHGSKKLSSTFVAIVIAAVCVVLMLSVVVFAVNHIYKADVDPDRPADFDPSESDTGDVNVMIPGSSGESDKQENKTDLPESTDDTDNADESEPDTAPETDEPDTDSTVEPETEPVPEPARYTVTLKFYNREPVTVTTESVTVGELLALVGYELKDSDRMYIDTESYITEDTVIDVDTVEYKTVSETVELLYESEINELQTIPRGEKNIRQYGQNGSKTVEYTVEYVNGQEINRTLAKETVTAYPVNEIYDIGVGGVITGADGVTYSYSYYRVVPATYYDIEGYTYAGTMAGEGTIATDFNFLPLGTRVYVKNDSFDFGVRTVEDTGTMLNDYEIDIWLSDSNPQKSAFKNIGYCYDMVIYYLD